jgi:hypothetical protein
LWLSEFYFAKAATCDSNKVGECRNVPEEGCPTGRAEVTLLLVILRLVVKRVDVGATDLLHDSGSLEVAGDSESATRALLAVCAVADAVDLRLTRYGD